MTVTAVTPAPGSGYRPYNKENPIPMALKTNSPVDDVLHVIAVISNPCEYRRRWSLARDFERRMLETPNVVFYLVELTYPGLNTEYHLTQEDNPRHLRISTETPLWHKESMINVAARHLLPDTWKAMAWVDADLLFENQGWALDCLKVLNGTCDIVQLFSHAIDMDANENAMTIFQGAMYQYVNGRKRSTGVHYWHCGYAWACTRDAFDRMGGLFDLSILGSGDDNMMRSWIGEKSWETSLHGVATEGYRRALMDFAGRCEGLELGYVPGVVRHFFHGSKKNRKYVERWATLVKWGYDPHQHITRDGWGLIVPSEAFPRGLAEDIMAYFRERNEDD